MKKKIMNKIERGCEAVCDFMNDHEEVMVVGYIVFTIGVSVASIAMYGARTKAIKAGGLLRKGELFM